MISAFIKNPRFRIACLYLIGGGLIMLAAKFGLIGAYGNSTPFWDQWDGEASALFIPSIEHHLQPAALFDAHCEHRIFFSRVLALGLFKLNGLWDPKTEMAAQSFLHVGSIILLIALCARTLATHSARLLFGCFTVALFSIPFGWENTLWGFQSQFYFVSFFGLIGIACCWWQPTLSRGWWLGVLAFSLGLLSMASGLLAPAVTCGLLVVRAIQDRRDWWRQACGILVLVALAGIGFLLVRHVPGHDALKAHSLHQFFKVLFKIASWPAKSFWLAPLFQAPLILLLAWALWQRRPATDPAWLLITLGLWGASQSASIAYGRVAGYDSSRYADNFALTLCIGLACLLYLLSRIKERLKTPVIVLSVGWFAVVGGSLHTAIARLPAKIAEKKALSMIEETHVRAYLASHDIAELTDKPFLHIPYPDPTGLAAMLDRPSLREILPANLRDPLSPTGRVINPEGGFHPDGYSPDTTARPNETIWGSYVAASSTPAGGVIELSFPASNRTSWLKMWVAGNPRASGMSLAVIDEHGRSKKIPSPSGSGNFWRSVFFSRPAGPFTLRIVDDNPTEWLAFTLPCEVGPATLATGFLLGKASWIACLGLALIVFTIIRDPERRQFTSSEFLGDVTVAGARLLRENRWLRITSFIVPIAMFALLAWRQHRFVDHYAVNMMFWDQWDFYLPFFKDQDFWSIFTRQHGPHRQGAGFLITHILANLSNWNSRWDAFGTSFSLIAAAVAGFAITVKCGCRARFALPVVALVFFNLRQYEIFVGASNLSHGAIPVLLLMLYGLSWFVAAPVVRLALLSALTFLLIFTGFGIFAGLLTPLLVAIEAAHAFKDRQNLRASLALAALALTLVSWAIFVHGYKFAPAVDGFHFPHERPWEYFYFTGLMLGNFYGIPGYYFPSIVVGLLITAGLTALCAQHGWQILRHGIDGRRISVVIFSLSAFALLYCFNTAVGRVCLGIEAAPQASRYVTLMIPAGLAVYLGLTRALPRQAFAMGVFYVGLLCAGTLVLRPSDWESIRWFHDGREAWKAAYLETHDELLANQRSKFQVYPIPGKITERLKYLEEHRLNLFTPGK